MMGLYDTILVYIRCPKCHSVMQEFQTKALKGRCCRQFSATHEHDTLCKTNKYLCHKNDKIDVKELDKKTLKKGYFIAYATCRSPECEWNNMRRGILEDAKEMLPFKLSERYKLSVWQYAGRPLDIKVYFNKKNGQLLRVRPIPHSDPKPESLLRAPEILAKHLGPKWTDALKETGDPYIAMRKLAR